MGGSKVFVEKVGGGAEGAKELLLRAEAGRSDLRAAMACIIAVIAEFTVLRMFKYCCPRIITPHKPEKQHCIHVLVFFDSSHLSLEP